MIADVSGGGHRQETLYQPMYLFTASTAGQWHLWTSCVLGSIFVLPVVIHSIMFPFEKYLGIILRQLVDAKVRSCRTLGVP